MLPAPPPAAIPTANAPTLLADLAADYLAGRYVGRERIEAALAAWKEYQRIDPGLSGVTRALTRMVEAAEPLASRIKIGPRARRELKRRMRYELKYASAALKQADTRRKALDELADFAVLYLGNEYRRPKWWAVYTCYQLRIRARRAIAAAREGGIIG